MTAHLVPSKQAAHAAGIAALAALVAVVFGACTDRREADPSAGVVASAANGLAVGVSSSEARFIANLDGFQGPESVRYDPEQDLFFVSNMTGYGSVKDGNGYISRLAAAGARGAEIFVQGGKNGVELHAPKGMALHGDTLWVADVDVLRAFDRRTGAPLASVDFKPVNVTLLNDVATGPDGAIYVTDTGILMSEVGVVYVGGDRIFRVGPNRSIAVVDSGPALRRPNGITWDSTGKRWIVVSFDPFQGEVAAIAPGERGRQVLRRGLGKLDGVEVLPSGAILFASWADSSVHALANGRDRQLVREVPEPADIGVDTRRGRLAIPLSTLGRVQLWSLGRLGQPAPVVGAASRR
jgi:sugar lactone lactonase YvrE